MARWTPDLCQPRCSTLGCEQRSCSGTLDSSIVPTSILDPPVRTLLLQRTRVKVERCEEEEDEVRSALGRITRTEPGGLIEGREASFIAKLPPHVAP